MSKAMTLDKKDTRDGPAQGAATEYLQAAIEHTLGDLSLRVAFALSAPWTVLWGPSGAGKTSLLRVLLPLARPFLLTAAVLAFTHTVGEFGVVLMIGGGIPGVTKTLSISIYDQVQDFAYTQANHTALLLLGFSFLALLVIYGRRGRVYV